MNDADGPVNSLNPYQEHTPVERGPLSLMSVEAQRTLGQVQAKMILARTNPRDRRLAMELILQDCTNLDLAKEATYSYARGGTAIQGPTIRLLETIAQRWGNLEHGIEELSRSPGSSECRAYAWDMESNNAVERKFQVKHVRENGKLITDEREIYNLVANLGQRRKRSCLEAVIPKEVLNAAEQQCEETLIAKADLSPANLKKMVELFTSSFGVTQKQIETRIQRDLPAIRPAQLVQLQRIYQSLRDGLSSPDNWFKPDTAAPPAKGNEGLRARLTRQEKADVVTDGPVDRGGVADPGVDRAADQQKEVASPVNWAPFVQDVTKSIAAFDKVEDVVKTRLQLQEHDIRKAAPGSYAALMRSLSQKEASLKQAAGQGQTDFEL